MSTLNVPAPRGSRCAGAAVRTVSAQNLGTPISEAEIAAWDISILPDGTGLPPGSGTPAEGARIYAAEVRRRATARTARAALAAALAGGGPLTGGIETTKTIANFWPYATTLFDFTRRAMPWPKPRTLTNDEVYALTAYMLSLNKIIGENDVMNARRCPRSACRTGTGSSSAFRRGCHDPLPEQMP